MVFVQLRVSYWKTRVLNYTQIQRVLPRVSYGCEIYYLTLNAEHPQIDDA
jgi:hypothetical protein